MKSLLLLVLWVKPKSTHKMAVKHEFQVNNIIQSFAGPSVETKY